MSEEQLTPEEATALEAMEQDTGEGIEEPVEAKEPAEEPDKEPAKEPEFKSTRTDEKPPEGFVPHQAMHAERVKRQEVEKRLADLEAKLEESSQEPPPAYVDPLEDPDGFRKFTEYQQQQFQSRIEQQQQAIQRQQQEQAIYADVSKSETEFQAKTPDYPQAVQHLHDTRVRELQSMGYAPQDVQRQIQQDVRGIYAAAKQIGMNPAELAYQRAMSLGYSKAAPKQDEAQKVEALAKAQDATSGVTSTGAPQEGRLTIEQLAKMSEDEIAKIPEDQFKKVMGG